MYVCNAEPRCLTSLGSHDMKRFVQRKASNWSMYIIWPTLTRISLILSGNKMFSLRNQWFLSRQVIPFWEPNISFVKPLLSFGTQITPFGEPNISFGKAILSFGTQLIPFGEPLEKQMIPVMETETSFTRRWSIQHSVVAFT